MTTSATRTPSDRTQPESGGWEKCFHIFSEESGHNRNNRLADIVVENIEDKREGYPRLAAVMNSDANFANFRKFGYVRTRLLLQTS